MIRTTKGGKERRSSSKQREEDGPHQQLPCRYHRSGTGTAQNMPIQTMQFLQGLFPMDVFEINVVDATRLQQMEGGNRRGNTPTMSYDGMEEFCDTPPKQGMNTLILPVLQQLEASPASRAPNNQRCRRASAKLQRALNLSSDSKDGKRPIPPRAQRYFMISSASVTSLDSCEHDCGISPTHKQVEEARLLKQAREFAKKMNSNKPRTRASASLLRRSNDSTLQRARRLAQSIKQRESVSSSSFRLRGGVNVSRDSSRTIFEHSDESTSSSKENEMYHSNTRADSFMVATRRSYTVLECEPDRPMNNLALTLESVSDPSPPRRAFQVVKQRSSIVVELPRAASEN